MLVKKVELYIKGVIKGKKKGIFPTFIKGVLFFLSILFGLSVRFKNWCFDKGWMRKYVPPVSLVISVGNIVAGGTGKTPFTLFLASHFYGRRKLAILTRGYRSKAEKLKDPVLLCAGEGPQHHPTYCGDEPYLLAKRFPESLVIVGWNRRKGSFLAAKEGAEVILLDDAMQHRRLARDLDIVLIDAGDPFGCDHFLPRGFLREEKKSLGRADLLVINHAASKEQYNRVKAYLQAYTSAPSIGIQTEISNRTEMDGQEITSFQNQRIGLFCTIANPEYFKSLLEAEGALVVSELCLPDHDTIKEKSLERFAKECKQLGAAWLVCTEKDYVKLPNLSAVSLPVAWVQIELKIVEGKDEWKNFITHIEKMSFR
ncbi:MAG: tetraacyldisaccharide 4'-kinase [Parachlamydia sp.]|jgi:tetraacyldisaccharide 4'-kinase|nr:tetraacyldisaccharide 4'-kinase [Parachlamydia sp.]